MQVGWQVTEVSAIHHCRHEPFRTVQPCRAKRNRGTLSFPSRRPYRQLRTNGAPSAAMRLRHIAGGSGVAPGTSAGV